MKSAWHQGVFLAMKSMHACSTRKVLVVWCLLSTENGKGCWPWCGSWSAGVRRRHGEEQPDRDLAPWFKLWRWYQTDVIRGGLIRKKAKPRKLGQGHDGLPAGSREELASPAGTVADGNGDKDGVISPPSPHLRSKRFDRFVPATWKRQGHRSSANDTWCRSQGTWKQV
jgi:hypothetical protein